MLNLSRKIGFKDMVQTSLAAATTEFGGTSKEYKAVKAAWKAVGL